MAKRVTKSTLARVKARKAAKKIDPPIVLELDEKAFVGEHKDHWPTTGETYMQSDPSKWPQSGKPNWGLIGVGLFAFAFWAIVTWFFVG
jgi:hypothetical protein